MFNKDCMLNYFDIVTLYHNEWWCSVPSPRLSVLRAPTETLGVGAVSHERNHADVTPIHIKDDEVKSCSDGR